MPEIDPDSPDHLRVPLRTLWWTITVVATIVGFTVWGSFWFSDNVIKQFDHVLAGQETLNQGQDRLEKRVESNHVEAVQRSKEDRDEWMRRQDGLQHQMTDLRNQFTDLLIYGKRHPQP